MFLLKLLSRLFRRKECPPHYSEKHYSSIGSTLSDDTLKNSDSECPRPTAAVDDNHTPNVPSVHLIPPRAIYDGGFDTAAARGVCLRIANGGAGQTGFIQAWADAFIQHMVAQGEKPFQVAWYLGDTTESLNMLATGVVDVALTYNPAAEQQVVHSGASVQRVYAFRDHFILVGPITNPACLEDDDDILTMFNKLVTSGNRDVISPPDPDIRPATRFLSRFDKSATNIKESHLFVTIGQVPWALDYSKWYHQYPRFPKEALEAASLLSEYTLTDQGSWISASKSIKSRLRTFKIGSDDSSDPLLNPSHLLLGSRASGAHIDVCKNFMDWVRDSNGGQKVVERFQKNGQRLYSKAPGEEITRCLVQY